MGGAPGVEGHGARARTGPRPLSPRRGLDVVFPQLLGRTEFIDALDQVASDAGATFHELVILDTATAVVQRFLARRAALDAAGERHPESAIESGREAEGIAGVIEALRRLPERRPRTRFIDGIASAYEELCKVVA